MGWIEECKAESAKIPIKKKREFLKHIHAGKSIGEAKELVDISLAAACGIIDSNIRDVFFSQ